MVLVKVGFTFRQQSTPLANHPPTQLSSTVEAHLIPSARVATKSKMGPAKVLALFLGVLLSFMAGRIVRVLDPFTTVCRLQLLCTPTATEQFLAYTPLT